MKNIQLTCAYALVKFLIAQKTLIDGKKHLHGKDQKLLEKFQI